MAERPKLHRRKPHPWNVHRALKREDLLQTDGDSLTLRARTSLSSSSDSTVLRTESDEDLLASLMRHSEVVAQSVSQQSAPSHTFSSPSPLSMFSLPTPAF
jgi:hypothetical protein